MKLAIHGGSPVIDKESARFDWPIITAETRSALLSQLEKTISIYDKSGVFDEFESRFCSYVGRRFGLLSNSGTNALFSIYEGIGLGPEDEVIAPAYGFFATISSVTYTGAKIVFADCLPDGNVDPVQIERQITGRTKAVVVTHMWGIPCEMDALTAICQARKLHLIEDCSHAHGASYKGRPVGSFGSAAAWSLQGQKIISGGEGGIMLTDDQEIYIRANLQGHYNKRCRQEIPRGHELYEFAVTGFGLKNRAHPLAIAIALHQFSHLEAWLEQKRRFACKMKDALSRISFLRMPEFSNKKPSWYAFVMGYDADRAGVSREIFVKALEAEGLVEVDIPNSTCSMTAMPLFNKPHIAMPRLYHISGSDNHACPGAEKFTGAAIKLPVWARPEDERVVDAYVEGFLKVADRINDLRDENGRVD